MENNTVSHIKHWRRFCRERSRRLQTACCLLAEAVFQIQNIILIKLRLCNTTKMSESEKSNDSESQTFKFKKPSKKPLRQRLVVEEEEATDETNEDVL